MVAVDTLALFTFFLWVSPVFSDTVRRYSSLAHRRLRSGILDSGAPPVQICEPHEQLTPKLVMWLYEHESYLLDLPQSHIYEFHQNIYAVRLDRVTALIVVLAREPP